MRNVLQNFVRFLAQFEIEPTEFAVVATDYQVIARGVDVHA